MRKFLGRVQAGLGLVLLFAAFATVWPAAAVAEKRVALVIGNDRYPSLPPHQQLQRAGNDAEAIGSALQGIGFEVIRGRNLGRQAMIDKIAELTTRLSEGDTAAFFYAGHGVAIGGSNYLVPSDVPSVSADAESRVRGASIAEADVIAEIQARGVRFALLVIDACRDNPFPRTGHRSIGMSRGLSDARPARGVFSVYSAGFGQTALDRLAPDDPSRNSVFTRVFMEKIGNPALDLGAMAIEVREKVAELALQAKDATGRPAPHQQTPAYYDQTIGGRIYLAGRPPPGSQSTVAAPARAYVGVSIQDVTEELAAAMGVPARGALVAVPAEGGPASMAGLEAGDVIVRFNGREISRARDVPVEVTQLEPGKLADVLVLRDGRELTRRLVMGKLPDAGSARQLAGSGAAEPSPDLDRSKERKLLGLGLSDLPEDIRRKYALRPNEGVLITSVDPGSKAEERKIQPGDVIKAFGRQGIGSLGDADRQIREWMNRGMQTAPVLVSTRDGKARYVALPLN